MSLIEKFKNFLNRQEQSSLQYDQKHEAFDEETDGYREHKDHMMDRVEDDEGFTS